MTRGRFLLSLVLLLALAPAALADDRPLAFRVGKVITMNSDDDVINNAVVIVRGQKIETIGRASAVAIPDDAKIIEMKQCWLVPGLVEGHNHTAAGSGDLHDYVYLTNPGLRTVDSIIPGENDAKEAARSGGVTSALCIPGSGTNMSGLGTVVKMAGDSVDEMVLKFPGSVKVAQAGNPERYWWGVGRSMMNYNTRQTLEKALTYHQEWEAYEAGETEEKPQFNPVFDDFRDLYRRNYVASVHTQAFQVVMTTIDMLANKLEIKTVLDHSTFDGWKTAPLVVEQGDVITLNGPRQFHLDRTQRKLHGNAARWWGGGVHKLGINTDAPVIPQRELSYQAAMACWYGWTPYEALAGLTRVPAEALLVDDRIGSIEPGKDADFCLWDGDPLDPRSTCWVVVINGKVVQDAREGRRF